MASPLQLAQYVQQQGEIGRQRGTQSRLAQLAGQAYGAPAEQQRGYVQQAIATDPDAGFAMGQNLQGDRTQRMQGLSQKARMLVAYHEAGNRAGVDGLYPQLAQEAQQLGLGQNIPPQWDESYLPGMQQLASLGGGAGAPAGLREFEAMTQGLSADDRERARRINLGLEGRASNAGMGFGTFKDAQGFDRPQRNNPRSGQVEIWYDEQGRWVPLGEAAGGVGQSPTQFTGADGAPVSIGADIPANVAADIMRNEAQWATAPDMATAHLPEQRVAQFSGTPAGLGRGRRPEDEAAAKRAAETAVDLAALPQRQAIETQGAIERTRGTEEAKADVERQKGRNKARLSLDQATARIGRVDSLVESILPRIGAMTAGWGGNMLANVPGTAASDLRKDIGTLQAIAGFDELNAMRASSPTGGALGNVTERELAFLQSVVRNIETSQSPEQLRRNLLDFQREVRGSWQRVNDAYQQDYGGQYGPAPSDGPDNQFQNAAPVVDGPRPGDVQDGYRFRGGNPGDPSAWERL